MPYVPVAELKDYVGKELGRSEWLTIDQERINLFAEATGDYQFIHVDPVKAAQTPFGSTIAHGFLSLSLIPKLMEGILIMPEGLKMVVNYGLDSVRFIQPVKVDSKVRLKVDLSEVTGLTQMQLDMTCGDDKTKLPAGLTVPARWPCGED